MLSFKEDPFLIAIYQCDAQYVVIKKSTQCGISEYLICRVIYKAKQGWSIFYVIPTLQFGYQFVKERYDKTIIYTPEYREWQKSGMAQSEDHGRFSESLTLKNMGAGVIAFTGSNSTVGFTGFPADEAVIDEMEECDQNNIKMAPERLARSDYRFQIKVSNPRFEGMGIDEEFQRTCQAFWHIKHDCGNYVHPEFFKHVVRQVEENTYILRDEDWEPNLKRDIHVICDKCGKPINRKGEGVWIRKYPRREKVGFHVSKLFSSKTPIIEIVDRFNLALENQTLMQRVYNADFGEAYTAKGAKIDREMLNDCVQDFYMPDQCAEPCVAGVDVGNVMNVRINQILPDRLRAVFIGTVREEEELDELCRRYHIVCGVIDSMPEMRLARRVVRKMRWFKANYTEGKTKDHVDKVDRFKNVSAERTPLLDAVKEMIVIKALALPRNAADIPDYYDQMMANVRYFDEKEKRYIWTEGSKADHYFHAEAYALLAKRILPALRR